MKILVFSDIHGDYGALERLMKIEADLYFAAGDLTSWGRGLDRCGEIVQARAGRVYVLPGNHESAEMTAALCLKFGLHHFHEQSFEAGGYHIGGLGYSSPTPFNTPGEYTERELAEHQPGDQPVQRDGGAAIPRVHFCAPAARNKSAVSLRPSSSAIVSAVLPRLSRASRSAPRARRSFTASS